MPDEPVSESALLWAARRVVQQHEEPPSADRATGLCAQCPDDGTCPMLDWAKATLARYTN
jgi:hypothetical protein